jgi:hypothetical protein
MFTDNLTWGAVLTKIKITEEILDIRQLSNKTMATDVQSKVSHTSYSQKYSV